MIVHLATARSNGHAIVSQKENTTYVYSGSNGKCKFTNVFLMFTFLFIVIKEVPNFKWNNIEWDFMLSHQWNLFKIRDRWNPFIITFWNSEVLYKTWASAGHSQVITALWWVSQNPKSKHFWTVELLKYEFGMTLWLSSVFEDKENPLSLDQKSLKKKKSYRKGRKGSGLQEL